MERYAIVEVKRAPVVHVRVVAEANDDNYPRYLEELGAAFRELDRFAMIFNTGDLSRFPAKYREAQSAWLAETRSEFEGRWVSSAFVIDNQLIRGVLRTLFWLQEPYYRYRLLADEGSAWKWTEGALVEAGVSLDVG